MDKVTKEASEPESAPNITMQGIHALISQKLDLKRITQWKEINSNKLREITVDTRLKQAAVPRQHQVLITRLRTG